MQFPIKLNNNIKTDEDEDGADASDDASFAAVDEGDDDDPEEEGVLDFAFFADEGEFSPPLEEEEGAPSAAESVFGKTYWRHI